MIDNNDCRLITCLEQDSFCINCDINNDCDTCVANYSLNMNNLCEEDCTQIISNCSSCDPNYPSKCVLCLANYIFDPY